MTLPPFTVIEGNIGAGKTTLATLLAERFNRRLILEEFDDNPFLSLFYRDPERYAFPVELFFMAERHKQLQNELTRPELFTQGTISDYLFIKTLLFARNSLTEQEFRLFGRLFRALDVNFPQPELIVYLHRPVKALQANIARRGRSFERDMKDDYLASVQSAYFSYFRTLRETPVVVLDLGENSFTEDASLFEEIVELITRPHGPGLHTFELRSRQSVL
ncbi:deoxyadenosine/deoxycytidine kinase [Lewinella aquimaris]|uniref:Deoxyadenosine/deoxycytidine kinase n=1 Tax=Neolewinella aquimaris TaxID=1835722 RepID=A0A840DY74_9BACT|nr:deoxynucleoside kinase [Neolewinella aquimaris]MBB4078184.1 deoxyadenosine/deoxycytidine kinase [Neolewinella aquimaris]